MKNKNKFKILIWSVPFAAFLIFIDQVIKWYLLNYHPSLVIKNYTSLFNFGGNSDLFFLSVIFIILFLALFLLEKDRKFWIILIMFAGAAGNLIDRVFRGFVVDYLEVKIGREIYFNLADILLGAGLFIYLIIVAKKAKEDAN